LRVAPEQVTAGVTPAAAVPVKVTENGYRAPTFVVAVVPVLEVLLIVLGERSDAVQPVGLVIEVLTVVPDGSGNKLPVVPVPLR